jgi:hypothetical protein
MTEDRLNSKHPGVTPLGGIHPLGHGKELSERYKTKLQAGLPASLYLYFDPDVIREITTFGANRQASEPELLHLMKCAMPQRKFESGHGELFAKAANASRNRNPPR